MARRGRTTPNQIETEERQIRALELRKAGVSLRQIAEELGYASPSGACEAVKAALDKARAEPAQELRDLTAARLDEMLVVAYENALQGDVDSMAMVLRIEERRARLFGIDRREAPVKVGGMPRLEKAEDGRKAISLLFEKVASGEISASEAEGMVSIAARHTGEVEKTDLAEQLAELRELALANYEKEKTNAKNQNSEFN